MKYQLFTDEFLEKYKTYSDLGLSKLTGVPINDVRRARGKDVNPKLEEVAKLYVDDEMPVDEISTLIGEKRWLVDKALADAGVNVKNRKGRSKKRNRVCAMCGQKFMMSTRICDACREKKCKRCGIEKDERNPYDKCYECIAELAYLHKQTKHIEYVETRNSVLGDKMVDWFYNLFGMGVVSSLSPATKK